MMSKAGTQCNELTPLFHENKITEGALSWKTKTLACRAWKRKAWRYSRLWPVGNEGTWAPGPKWWVRAEFYGGPCAAAAEFSEP